MQNFLVRVSQKLETTGFSTVNAVSVSCNVTKLVNFVLQNICCLCVCCWKTTHHFNFTVILCTARCLCKKYQTKHLTCQTVGEWGCRQFCWKFKLSGLRCCLIDVSKDHSADIFRVRPSRMAWPSRWRCYSCSKYQEVLAHQRGVMSQVTLIFVSYDTTTRAVLQ
jgi:hypothetical protein